MNAKTPLIFSLREQIVDRIRTDVLSGRLVEGERLNEAKLVEQFSVSRTPIREALQQLTHEGLLEGRPNHGVKVANCPPDSIRELVVPIRRRVETFALQSFFHELSEADFDAGTRSWTSSAQRLRRPRLCSDCRTRYRISPLDCRPAQTNAIWCDLDVAGGTRAVAFLEDATSQLRRSSYRFTTNMRISSTYSVAATSKRRWPRWKRISATRVSGGSEKSMLRRVSALDRWSR